MSNFENAVKIAVDSIMEDADFCDVDWDEVNNWAELLDWLGIDSADMRDNSRTAFVCAARDGGFPWCFFDDMSIEDSDGSIKSYRQLTNAVRKQLF